MVWSTNRPSTERHLLNGRAHQQDLHSTPSQWSGPPTGPAPNTCSIVWPTRRSCTVHILSGLAHQQTLHSTSAQWSGPPTYPAQYIFSMVWPTNRPCTVHLLNGLAHQQVLHIKHARNLYMAHGWTSSLIIRNPIGHRILFTHFKHSITK